jgi:hypothetical protein
VELTISVFWGTLSPFFFVDIGPSRYRAILSHLLAADGCKETSIVSVSFRKKCRAAFKLFFGTGRPWSKKAATIRIRQSADVVGDGLH